MPIIMVEWGGESLYAAPTVQGGVSVLTIIIVWGQGYQECLCMWHVAFVMSVVQFGRGGGGDWVSKKLLPVLPCMPVII